MSPVTNSLSRASKKSLPSKWINWWKKWPNLNLSQISKIMLINNLLNNTILKDWSSKKRISITKLEKLMKTSKRRWMSLPKKLLKALMRSTSSESKSTSVKLNPNLKLITNKLKSMESSQPLNVLTAWLKPRKETVSKNSRNKLKLKDWLVKESEA